jgi:nickel-dependent lactate racemase
MKVRLDYGIDGIELEVPEWTQVLQMDAGPALPMFDRSLKEALSRPIGTPALATLARGRTNACIVISDITRPVPNSTILPPILRTLEEAGIARQAITILIGTGLHRPNEGDELVALVGAEVADHYTVVNHRARDENSLVHLGEASCGAPIWIDRLYVEADLKVATSLIEPHLMAGFSGGRKAICPGLMGVETMKVLHGPELMGHPNSSEGVIEGNPFHRQALEVAQKAGVDFTVNVAMNAQREITGVFAGDLEKAHAEGVRFVGEQNAAYVEEPVDVVVTSSAGFPLDLTFYQAVKGLTSVLPIIKEGGTILIAARCEEGIGSPEFTELITNTPNVQQFMDRLDDPEFFVIDQWQLQELCKVLKKAEVKLFSEGIDTPFVGRLLVDHVESLEAGLEHAYERHGRHPSIAAIPKGPYILPRSRT